MDAHFENQVIDELVAQGYSEDQVLDAIVELEDENNTLYLSGKGKSKKEVRKEKKEAKKAAKAEKKEEKKAAKVEKKETKKAAKAEKKEQKAAAKVAKKATTNKVAVVKKSNLQALADAMGPTMTKVAEIAANTAESNGLSDEAADEVVNKALEDAGIETEETVDTVVEEKKSKLPLILGIAGGVLAIVIIVVIILARRKK